MPKVISAGLAPAVSVRSTKRTKVALAQSLSVVDSSSSKLFNLALWSTKHLAQYLGCSEVAVRTWRRTGIGPEFIRVTPRQVRYRPEDVQEWLANNTLANTSQSVRQAR